jgi:hypothetical protein
MPSKLWGCGSRRVAPENVEVVRKMSLMGRYSNPDLRREIALLHQASRAFGKP